MLFQRAASVLLNTPTADWTDSVAHRHCTVGFALSADASLWKLSVVLRSVRCSSKCS